MITEATGPKITILADNRASDGLTSEHGLSLWIEADGKRILFDTGQGSALQHNLPVLGVEIDCADALVLSHGHYDHSGGLSFVLQHARHAQVCCHPASVQPRFSIREGRAKSIGMPEDSRDAIDTLPPGRLHWVVQPVMLSPRIGITGPIPRTSTFEDTGGPFYLDPEGLRADPINDDLALWIRTSGGVVVCTGCSHSGLVNTLPHVRQLEADGGPVQAILGGFHLQGATRDRLEHTVDALRALAPRLIVPCHCTGETAVALLDEELGERVIPGTAGQTYRLHP